MRRAAALGALTLALLTPACTGAERPEGVVERWLVSLNQGEAGRPDRYAPDEISEWVVPGWRDLEPGTLDRIEVGTDRGSLHCEEHCADVPFAVTTLEGDVTAGVVVVESVSGRDWRVAGVDLDTPVAESTSSAWAATGADPTAWFLAIVTAIILVVLAVSAVRLVRGSEQEPS